MEIRKSTKEEHEESIKVMKQFFDDSDKPQVGIFWLDTKNMSLFGVQKGDADLYDTGAREYTYPKLHKTFWQKQHHRAVAKKDTSSIFYNERDYTQIPRGRVFVRDGEFIIKVGMWINDVNIPKLTELMEDEFNLYDKVVYEIDEHWNLGRGWSEEQF